MSTGQEIAAVRSGDRAGGGAASGRTSGAALNLWGPIRHGRAAGAAPRSQRRVINSAGGRLGGGFRFRPDAIPPTTAESQLRGEPPHVLGVAGSSRLAAERLARAPRVALRPPDERPKKDSRVALLSPCRVGYRGSRAAMLASRGGTSSSNASRSHPALLHSSRSLRRIGRRRQQAQMPWSGPILASGAGTIASAARCGRTKVASCSSVVIERDIASRAAQVSRGANARAVVWGTVAARCARPTIRPPIATTAAHGARRGRRPGGGRNQGNRCKAG